MPASQRVLFTGFIGERLLPRLADVHPDAVFLCLVQPRFADAAARSLADIETRHPRTRARFRIVAGDITLPGLGCPDAARELPALTAAYHLAADYDLAVARETGMRVNVEGTRNVLRFLAGAPRLRRLHYVSTAYVSGTATGTFRETDLDVGQRFKNFYQETKFLAEVEDPANPVPVDFIVDALAGLAGAPGGEGKTYHLTDPAPRTVSEVARLLARKMGKSFALVPIPGRVARAAFRPTWVQRYFGMPVETLDYFDHPCRYDTTQATADLRAVGVACPPFESYVGPMVAFYRAHRDRVRRAAMA